MAQILIVDDLKEIHRLVRRSLAGHTLLHAYSGEEAEHILKDNVVDLVLLDLHMPGTSGYIVLDRIRSLAHRPITIMFSNDYSRETIEMAKRGGAHDFWKKDADTIAMLDAKIAKVLAMRLRPNR